MGDMRNAYRSLFGKPRGNRPHGRLGLDGRIILEWMLEKWMGKFRSRSMWLSIRTSGGLF